MRIIHLHVYKTGIRSLSMGKPKDTSQFTCRDCRICLRCMLLRLSTLYPWTCCPEIETIIMCLNGQTKHKTGFTCCSSDVIIYIPNITLSTVRQQCCGSIVVIPQKTYIYVSSNDGNTKTAGIKYLVRWFDCLITDT